MKRVAVTGFGLITPAGNELTAIWDCLQAGRVCISSVEAFDAASYGCSVAGKSTLAATDSAVDGDRLSQLALIAARSALAAAQVTSGSNFSESRIGLALGTAFGRLGAGLERDAQSVQRVVCDELRIAGPVRTFVGGGAAGAIALVRGAQAVARGEADVVVAGGVDAPLTPFAWRVLQSSGLFPKMRGGRPEEGYRPFDARHSGTVFGEGAAFLILESRAGAEQRGATIHGELAGWATNSDGYMPYYTIDPSARPLARAIQAAVSMAGIDASEVRAVFPHASGYPIDDVTDNYAMHEVFGARTRAVPVAVPKASFGNLLGAAAPLDVTLALTSSRTGRLPGHPGFTRLAPGIELDVVGPTREVDAWEHSIVTSRGYGGINASVVVRS